MRRILKLKRRLKSLMKQDEDVAEALTVLGIRAGEVRELMRSYDPAKSVEDNVRDLLRLRAPKI